MSYPLLTDINQRNSRFRREWTLNGTLSNFSAHNLRIAGLLYLGIIVLGVTSEGILRGGLIDWRDAHATTAEIAGSMTRFRLSIGFDLLMALLDVTLAVVFFHTLRGIDELLALLAMVLRLIQSTIIMTGLTGLFAVEQAIETGNNPLPLLARHAAGYDLGLFFFAFNAFLMADLLFRARVPRVIAGGIAAAGLVYLVGSVTRFLAPEWNEAMQVAYVIPLMGETALMVWLLFGSTSTQRPQQSRHILR